MKYVLALLLFITAKVVCAQNAAVYFKFDGSRVNTVDNADYYRIVGKLDSATKLYPFNEYYKSGVKKLSGKSFSEKYYIQEGEEITYFANGRVKSKGTYKKGEHTGLFYSYFPNGQLYTVQTIHPAIGANLAEENWLNFDLLQCTDSTGRDLAAEGTGYYIGYDDSFSYITEEGPVKGGKRSGNWKGISKKLKLTFKEQYENGKLISGTSVDSLGQTHTYQTRFTSPEFAGGLNAFDKFIRKKTRYLVKARQQNIQGKVYLTYVVSSDGSIKDIKILLSLHPLLDAEAVKVLQASPKWTPGFEYGIAADIQYSVPIAFNLAER